MTRRPITPRTQSAKPRATARPRGVHVVDLAVVFAELERSPGVTQADIARRYRKSPGYVSVLCRLGHALRRLSPEEREALHVPHLTFKATQAIVSRASDADGILRGVEALASLRPPDRRPRAARGAAGLWHRPLPESDTLDPLPVESATSAGEFVFRWDEAAARRDPGRVFAEYEEFIRAMTNNVMARLRRVVEETARPLLPTRRDAADRIIGADDAWLHADLSIQQLNDRVAATLRAHRAKLDEFLAERERRRNPPPPDGTDSPP